MDKGRETRLFHQQTLEQALALVELAVDFKEKSETAANQANALREAALRAHRSSLSLSQSSRQLVLLAKSLITNLKNSPSKNNTIDLSFEECRKRLAALLDLQEDRVTKIKSENSYSEKVLDFDQRLRKLEDVCLGRPMVPSFSNHSRLRAKTPCGMDDRYPSDSPRENIFNDLIIDLPTVQEHGLINFSSNRPHSSPNYSFKSLRKVKMSLLKLDEDINE